MSSLGESPYRQLTYAVDLMMTIVSMLKERMLLALREMGQQKIIDQ